MRASLHSSNHSSLKSAGSSELDYAYYPMWIEPDGTVRYAEVVVREQGRTVAVNHEPLPLLPQAEWKAACPVCDAVGSIRWGPEGARQEGALVSHEPQPVAVPT